MSSGKSRALIGCRFAHDTNIASDYDFIVSGKKIYKSYLDIILDKLFNGTKKQGLTRIETIKD